MSPERKELKDTISGLGLTMKEWYNQVYLLSDHWKTLRAGRLKLDGHQCQGCGSKSKLQVHHLRYRNIYDVEMGDLKTLCRTCHKAEHFGPKSVRIRKHKKKPQSDFLRDRRQKQRRLYRLVKKWVKSTATSYAERFIKIMEVFGDVPFPPHMQRKLKISKKKSPP